MGKATRSLRVAPYTPPHVRRPRGSPHSVRHQATVAAAGTESPCREHPVYPLRQPKDRRQCDKARQPPVTRQRLPHHHECGGPGPPRPVGVANVHAPHGLLGVYAETWLEVGRSQYVHPVQSRGTRQSPVVVDLPTAQGATAVEQDDGPPLARYVGIACFAVMCFGPCMFHGRKDRCARHTESARGLCDHLHSGTPARGSGLGARGIGAFVRAIYGFLPPRFRFP